MGDPSTVDGTPTNIRWQSIPADTIPSPIVRELPYLELKLEHPTLEPVGFGDRFFPDVIPYQFDGTPRVWYWRPALAPSSTARSAVT
ncbi:hypothetical protein [Haloplanus aerogenes]|uniref:hypothetical protein n=1 Tax=Haloplanus aerogenes TaxID=660522 RepID=UPI0018F442F5|nr:hypothetical protein [Haloplanus aerogenes]